MKQHKIVKKHQSFNYERLSGPIEDIIKFLQSTLNEFGPATEIFLELYDDYTECYMTIERLETDKERDKRLHRRDQELKRKQKLKIKKEQNERATYERLRNKYE